MIDPHILILWFMNGGSELLVMMREGQCSCLRDVVGAGEAVVEQWMTMVFCCIVLLEALMRLDGGDEVPCYYALNIGGIMGATTGRKSGT